MVKIHSEKSESINDTLNILPYAVDFYINHPKPLLIAAKENIFIGYLAILFISLISFKNKIKISIILSIIFCAANFYGCTSTMHKNKLAALENNEVTQNTSENEEKTEIAAASAIAPVTTPTLEDKKVEDDLSKKISGLEILDLVNNCQTYRGYDTQVTTTQERLFSPRRPQARVLWPCSYPVDGKSVKLNYGSVTEDAYRGKFEYGEGVVVWLEKESVLRQTIIDDAWYFSNKYPHGRKVRFISFYHIPDEFIPKLKKSLKYWFLIPSRISFHNWLFENNLEYGFPKYIEDKKFDGIDLTLRTFDLEKKNEATALIKEKFPQNYNEWNSKKFYSWLNKTKFSNHESYYDRLIYAIYDNEDEVIESIFSKYIHKK